MLARHGSEDAPGHPDAGLGFPICFALAALGVAIAVRVGASFEIPRVFLGMMAVVALGLALSWALAHESRSG